ncbi:SmdB family multidrug efflux ABC transporter permease/ATP-binding protein [Salmonella enterica]|nr:SmdB family multidrug efflux ABC transporter permease/ATP-binding protein [Salmonella enterica]
MARLAAFDMDGTLLMPDHHLGRETIATLARLRERDITLTFATGRHVLEMRHILGTLSLDAYLITGNGTRIHSLEGDVLHRQDLDPQVADTVMHHAWDTRASMHVFNDNGWFTGQEIPALLQAHVYSGFRYQVIDIKSIPAHQVTKICFCGDHDDLIRLRIQLNETLEERAHLCFSAVDCLEVLPLGCNKGSALAVLSNHLGLSLADCMAFGDAMNDREMLGSVGRGLIMGNAMPQLIAALPHLSVIGHCGNQAATVLRSAALIGAMLVAMFSLDWRMALVAILIFPAVLTVMIIYQRYSTPIVRRVRAYLADINDGFNEIINGMSVIQQFRQQARFGERMGEASRSHYMARMQTLRLDGFLLRPLLSLFSALILCGLLMLFSFTSAGTIEVGVLYAFISYLSRLNEPLIELTTQQSMLQQAVVAGERVFELMDRPRQRYGSDDRPLQSGAIDIDHLSFAYRDDNLVLQDITLSVPSRSFVALVGHTGSGKSTLASLLMGYYPLTQGEIRLDGREIASLNHRVLRQGVAMVQQDPVVMADTFLANVTLGRDVSEAQVWQALETVQLADLARGLSDGLHTHLGEQGNTLSVGQKQLLALARVLVDAPQILILDEATASIDSGTEQAIQQALAAIRERTTLVVIAHRLSTIVEADTILVLHRGQAVERGTHQQLLAAQGRYWQMYQLQLVGEELAASVHEEPGPAA